MKQDNDNEVLIEFAQQVRAAGDTDSLPLPWQPSILVAVYSSLVAAFVFFFSIHEELAAKLF